MKFTPFGNFNFRTQQRIDPEGKGLADIATISQNTLNSCKSAEQRLNPSNAPLRSVTSAVVTAIAWGKPLSINGNMSLNPRGFFASIVAFLSRAIAVFDALRVDDQESR